MDALKVPIDDLRTSALGPTAYIRTSAGTKREEGSPHIVILFGWAGSTMSDLNCYSKVYDMLFPCATQILVLRDPKVRLLSVAAQKEEMLPVAQKVEELLLERKAHISNGGGHTPGSDEDDSTIIADDDDEDEKREGERWFAEGERSGISTESPNQQRNVPGGEMVAELLHNAAHSVPPPPAPPGAEEEETSIRHITFWRNGFQFGDGELRRYDDPAQASILAEINSGRAPPSILGVRPGQPVELRVTKRTDEDYVLSAGSQGVLVHVFSVGGCSQLVLLSALLQSRSACPRITMPSAIIFDSCPARLNAVMMSHISALLPGPWNVVSRATIKTFFWFNTARGHLNQLLGVSPEDESDLLSTHWDRLHRLDLLPWMGKHTKRLCVYSESDTVIAASMVKDHLQEARQSGLDVSEVVFDDSSHVSHATKYPKQYWAEVLRVWKDASTSGQHTL